MVRQIVPVFFTMDIPATLAYYKGKLGFECLGTWQDPPVYAIVARDQHAIHFRCAEPATRNPDKYRAELLDAYRRCRCTLCRVRSPRRGIHSGTCQHAMALARVRSEGLRWPPAGFRREPLIFFGASSDSPCACLFCVGRCVLRLVIFYKIPLQHASGLKPPRKKILSASPVLSAASLVKTTSNLAPNLREISAQ